MAINVRMIYDNQVDHAAATASTEATGFPVENAVDMNRGSQWKTTTSGTHQLTVDLGSSPTLSGLGVANHNLGTLDGGGYTITLRGSTDNFSVSNDIVKTLTVANDDDYFATFTPTSSYRYWRLQADTGSGTAMEVGVFYLGTAITLDNNPDTGTGFADVPTAQVLQSQSISGLAVVKKVGRITRQFSMTFSNRLTAEWTDMETIFDTQDGPYKALFYVPRDDSASPTEGNAFYCRFTDPILQHNEVFQGIHNFGVGLREQQ
jgi:hypothetical protein